MHTYTHLSTILILITICNIVIFFYTVYQITKITDYQIKSMNLIGLKTISAGIMNYTSDQGAHTHSEVFKNFRYLLKSNYCEIYEQEFLAIIIITSAVKNMETRMSHRRAISEAKLDDLGLKRVFLLGEVSPTMSSIQQSTLQLEHDTYGDLVQGNFQDTYRNLSYKAWMGLHWTSSECKNAKFIIKMDDDLVYDIYYISTYLKTYSKQSSIPTTSNELILGHLHYITFPFRNPKSKWYVTRNEYANNSYPSYVAGWFYITNPSTAARLSEEAIQIPFFWIDDVWITGIVRERLDIPIQYIDYWFTYKNADLKCCIRDVQKFNFVCDYKVGPNNGDPYFLYIFLNAMKRCSEGKCKQRPIEYFLSFTCNI